MKIAHFLYDSIDNPWLGGGGAVRAQEINKHFPKNWNVQVFSANYPEAKVTQNQKFLGRPRKNYLLSRFEYFRSARSFIKNNHSEFDLIIEDYSPFSPLFLKNFIAQEKLLFISQNYFGPQVLKDKLGFLGKLAGIFETKSYQKIHNILYSSEDLQTQVHQFISSKFQHEFIVYNGVEDNYLDKKSAVQKKNQLLFLGRFEIQQKGIDRLLNIALELKKKLPHFKIILAGKGKDEVQIKTRIYELNLGDFIKVIPFVSGSNKKTLLQESKLLIMPSRYESWGISSLEAQACGTPVIASNIPGLRLTLQENKTGVLFDNQIDLVNKIIELINDEQRLNDMSLKAKLFAENFSWSKISQLQQDVYTSIIKQKKEL